MSAYQRPPTSNTLLAAVTAVATLVGAVGGLIATIYAVGITDSDTAASTPTPPAASATATSIPTPAPTPSPTPPGPPTPAIVVITAGADRWWGPPGASSGDEEDEGDEGSPGQSKELSLSWGCSRDRGNGRGKDCGSGLIAVYFDLAGLPDCASIDEAVLTLYSKDAADGMVVYALPATSGWSEKESDAPSCDLSNQTSGEAAENQWRWDVTKLTQDQHTGDAENLGFCLILKDDGGVIFGSREGARSGAPSLIVTYTAPP